jgi:hypothetical protein
MHAYSKLHNLLKNHIHGIINSLWHYFHHKWYILSCNRPEGDHSNDCLSLFLHNQPLPVLNRINKHQVLKIWLILSNLIIKLSCDTFCALNLRNFMRINFTDSCFTHFQSLMLFKQTLSTQIRTFNSFYAHLECMDGLLVICHICDTALKTCVTYLSSLITFEWESLRYQFVAPFIAMPFYLMSKLYNIRFPYFMCK